MEEGPNDISKAEPAQARAGGHAAAAEGPSQVVQEPLEPAVFPVGAEQVGQHYIEPEEIPDEPWVARIEDPEARADLGKGALPGHSPKKKAAPDDAAAMTEPPAHPSQARTKTEPERCPKGRRATRRQQRQCDTDRLR